MSHHLLYYSLFLMSQKKKSPTTTTKKKKKDYFFPFFSYKKYVIIVECKYDCHEPNGWCDKLTGMCTCEGKNSGLDCRACIAGFKRNHKTGYCEETQKGTKRAKKMIQLKSNQTALLQIEVISRGQTYP